MMVAISVFDDACDHFLSWNSKSSSLAITARPGQDTVKRMRHEHQGGDDAGENEEIERPQHQGVQAGGG
jgi:hypothetical protein